jgi:iron complex outermembrane receptor protein
VNLNYNLNPDQFVYGLVSRGHTPGSINLFEFTDPHTAYKEMSVINYEAGWKGSFADNQIRTQLDGYYEVFKNYQAQFALKQAILPGQSVAEVFQDALTDSTIWGIEFGFQSHFGAIGLDGGLAYSKSELGSFGLVLNEFQAIYGGPAYIDLNHSHTPFAPELTGNIGVEYTFNLGDNIGTLTPRLDVSYRGDSYARLFENPSTLLPSVTLLNLNVRYAHGPWGAEFWCTNLTDLKYVGAKQNVGVGTDPLYPTPHIVGILYSGPRRLFGVRVTRSF